MRVDRWRGFEVGVPNEVGEREEIWRCPLGSESGLPTLMDGGDGHID